MNQLVASFGLSAWKPWLTALLLPPVPFLFLTLVGARCILPRRGLGWTLVAIGVSGGWLSGCLGAAYWLDDVVLGVPPAASADRIAGWSAANRSQHDSAIIVLGSGRQALAPEYGTANLTPESLDRLRYGVWLGRRTGISVGFSGGTGWAQNDGGPAEADIAARIAADEYGRPLRWTESASRDTRENAFHTVAMLRAAQVRHLILVSNGWHLPRARRDFQRAADQLAPGLHIDEAPMGLGRDLQTTSLLWMPSSHGYSRMRSAWHELIGLWMGA